VLAVPAVYRYTHAKPTLRPLLFASADDVASYMPPRAVRGRTASPGVLVEHTKPHVPFLGVTGAAGSNDVQQLHLQRYEFALNASADSNKQLARSIWGQHCSCRLLHMALWLHTCAAIENALCPRLARRQRHAAKCPAAHSPAAPLHSGPACTHVFSVYSQRSCRVTFSSQENAQAAACQDPAKQMRQSHTSCAWYASTRPSVSSTSTCTWSHFVSMTHGRVNSNLIYQCKVDGIFRTSRCSVTSQNVCQLTCDESE
jgi:hypothetical protein